MRHVPHGLGAFLAILLLSGCGEEEKERDSASGPWDALAHPGLVDEDSDPNVVEVTLRAELGSKQYPGADPSEVWTYEGTVPGPLIQAKEGDQLVVHFQNQLPEATTVHWHGLRVPASMDGTLAMQAPIEPGGTFEYAFELRDAGLFWFHPHMRSDVQVEKGLYGTILVHGANEPESDHETVLVLDDVSVKPDGTFPVFLDDESKMLGRQGNVRLVNGVELPEVVLRRGSVERLRVVNVANGRFFNLRLEGHELYVIGTDGGLAPHPWATDSLLMSPGERYDVLFVPRGDPGAVFTLFDDPYDRGHDTGNEPPQPLMTVRISDASPLAERALPDAFPDIERLPQAPVDFPIVLDEAFDANAALVFTVNGETFPDVPPLSVPSGSVRVLGVQNASDMDHPFHLHGFFFQTLAVDGLAPAPESLVNKDTVIVKAQSSLDLVARFDEPGSWMYHCHILEHAEGGMMGEITVE
jgi:FtsP/CotA-like multicopper oxidase with cupredoxin domain